MFKKLSLAAIIASSVNGTLVLCAHAQEAPSGEAKVEEVFIWGAEVKASSLKLDEEKIALKQADHISDLLRIIPGVDVGGAHSLNQRITIRSMDDKDLRISIDGANQNTYMYHHMGNLQIHADILKSVEIEVGANSVINGGLGGSVRFETRSAADLLREGQRFGGRVQVSASDNASINYSLTGYGQLTDTVDVLAYYNFVDRDNYTVGGGKILNENGEVEEGTDGDVRGLKGELGDALIKFGWDISENQRLKIGYERYVDEGDYSYRPDMGLSTDLTISGFLNIPLVYPTKFTRDTYTLNYNLELGATTVKAAAYQNESTLWRDEHGLEPWRPALAKINEGVATNKGVNVLAETVIGSGVEQTYTYGLDYIQYDTQFIEDGLDISGEESATTALFVQNRLDFGSGLVLIPGLRYETSDVKSTVVDDTFSKPTGSLVAEFQASSQWLLSIGATEIFKAPELAEVFIGAGKGDTPNPSIEAEEGHNIQASVVYENEAFDTGVTLFKTKIEDHVYLGVNQGHMFIDGIEFYAAYTQDNWDVLVSFNTAESDLEAFAAFSDVDGARIDRQQGDTLALIANYNLPGLDIALHWDSQYVGNLSDGKALDGANKDNSKDGFTVHNVSARWTPKAAEGLAVTVGVDNLLDEFYASQSSRTGLTDHPLFDGLYLMDYEPGRNVKATISYQF